VSTRIWILGAPDPEMAAIESLLRECGETIVHAVDATGQRVHPGNAYRADCPPDLQGGMGEIFDTVYRVECAWDPSWESLACPVTTIDHHRPGDPGFGRPPSEFLSASSLGQVIAELARLGVLPETWERPRNHYGAGSPGEWRLTGYRGLWMVAEPWTYRGVVQPRHYQGVTVPRELVLTAAADHCLGAAYRGECLGVDPDALMRWRAESRSAHQGRDVDAVMADIETTAAALRDAPPVVLATESRDYDRYGQDPEWSGYPAVEFTDHEIAVADMRREPPWPELPEAATRLGIGYISGPLKSPDGRRKITVSGDAEQVRAFLEDWAPRQGLVDCYGDPARGFAGGYLP
jgi:hypothetical protein